MIHNLPWFVFPFKNVWCGGGGGGGRPVPPHPFILQNGVFSQAGRTQRTDELIDSETGAASEHSNKL